MKLSLDPRNLLAKLRTHIAGDQDPASKAEREPVIRKMNFDFAPEAIPRHWMMGSIFSTALANSLNLIFPAGERFFVRSVNHYLPTITDPELRDRVKRFYGQEGQHAHEHERFFKIMRGHGYDIETFLRHYQWFAYEVLAPAFPAKLHLAVTAALEHFTASFAEHALRTREFEELAPPVMAELLLWHAAEEIEHKDVAYDVLMHVDDSYALRMTGLALATVVLWGFWAYGVILLLRQEPELRVGRTLHEWRHAVSRDHANGDRMIKAILSYLDPDFHPSKVPNDHLATAYLDEIGRRDA